MSVTFYTQTGISSVTSTLARRKRRKARDESSSKSRDSAAYSMDKSYADASGNYIDEYSSIDEESDASISIGSVIWKIIDANTIKAVFIKTKELPKTLKAAL